MQKKLLTNGNVFKKQTALSSLECLTIAKEMRKKAPSYIRVDVLTHTKKCCSARRST